MRLFHPRLLLFNFFLEVPCLRNGSATTFDLEHRQGKFVLLLFQPLDFGYIGPVELELLDHLQPDCEV